jgi:Tn3 transposase DDE domain
VTLAYRSEGSAEQRLSAIGELIEPEADRILEQCEAHQATAGRNYLPFLTRFYSHHRAALFNFIESVELLSTSSDRSMTDAIRFLIAHRKTRLDRLPVRTDGSGEDHEALTLDLSFVGELWWPLVVMDATPKQEPAHVSRRWLEICVFTEVMRELKSGDLCIPGSDRYSDFREQFVSEEECRQSLESYAERSGIPTEPKAFVAALQGSLEEASRKADEGYPKNEYLQIDKGEAVLKRLRRNPDPAGLSSFERLLKERMTPVGILDVLSDTEQWLNWTKHFGPISGHDSKLANPAERYLVTAFCYGFDFGPTQASRSIRGLDRCQVAFVNQRHVTEDKLNEAITTVINGYNQFPLPKIWGLGKHASADGTKWDLHAQNLMSEYHLRYGGYGGIGYYMVSDMYIALFSRFTTCGSWEGHNILDYLVENDSTCSQTLSMPTLRARARPSSGSRICLASSSNPGFAIGKDFTSSAPGPNCATNISISSSRRLSIGILLRRCCRRCCASRFRSVPAESNPQPSCAGWQRTHERASSISPSGNWGMQSVRAFCSTTSQTSSCAA